MNVFHNFIYHINAEYNDTRLLKIVVQARFRGPFAPSVQKMTKAPPANSGTCKQAHMDNTRGGGGFSTVKGTQHTPSTCFTFLSHPSTTPLNLCLSVKYHSGVVSALLTPHLSACPECTEPSWSVSK